MNIPFLHPDMRPELSLRIEKVRNAMLEAGIPAVLIASNANLFYLSGTVFRGYVFISAEAQPLFILIPPSQTPDTADTATIHKPEFIPRLLEERGILMPDCLGLEFNDMLYSDVERLKAAFPGCSFMNASPVMTRARMVKTEYEVECMKVDGLHHAAVYSRIDKCYHVGMTDLEFQIEIERILRLEGCLGFLRVAGSRMEINMGSVISGDNADVPSPYDFSMGGGGADPSLPVGASGHIIHPGDAVMVDMNGGFNGYQTDMTRTWFLEKVSDLARKAHDCSIRILRVLEKMAVPGVIIGDLYRKAAEIVKEEGLEDYFMGHHSQAKFIGHGVGIQLNEQPVVMERNKTPLLENMTIALEPKFVVPGAGAVGVENTYRVTPDGLENLTSLVEELQELPS